MKTVRLRENILASFFLVILFFALGTSILGFFVVQKYIFERAQEQVRNDLKIVREVFYNRLDRMAAAAELIKEDDDLEVLKDVIGFDYLNITDAQNARSLPGTIVKHALEKKSSLGAVRVIDDKELAGLLPQRAAELVIAIQKTSKALPSEQKLLKSVLAFEYVKLFFDQKGNVAQVLYGGRIINKNFKLIDDIVNTVFENKLYNGKPLSTVTVFQDDVRVATNVLDAKGVRAVGTRVSEEVYRQVIEKGEKWLGRAFVVTDWYMTAYEPIRNVDNQTIGVLYLGILEQPFYDLRKKIFIAFLSIIAVTALIAFGLSYLLTKSLTNPLMLVIKTTKKISKGDWHSKVEIKSPIKEVNDLEVAVNEMSDELITGKKSLEESNQKMTELNKQYLDLIGFVTHELKGILASVVLNTYILRKQLLGPINTKQEDVLKSMTRNLDYLTGTVKNFLNLSRVEKGELQINKTAIMIREHVFDISLESFGQQAEDKKMLIVNEIPVDLKVKGDPGLLQIVVNNLISNAVKYGQEGGRLVLSCRKKDDAFEFSVYNDGVPIDVVDLDKLFKKYSRVIYRGMEKTKGTGIGLYITKEIVERHGGAIWVEPQEKGNTFKFTLKET